MILRILLAAAVILLAVYGAYVLFGRGEVVRVDTPTVTVEKPLV